MHARPRVPLVAGNLQLVNGNCVSYHAANKGLIGNERVRFRGADITGCIVAIAQAPVCISIGDGWFLAIFSTEDKLQEAMRRLGIEGYTTMKIPNGRKFLDSMWSQKVQVVLDPYYHEGDTRFTLVMPNTQQEGNA